MHCGYCFGYEINIETLHRLTAAVKRWHLWQHKALVWSLLSVNVVISSLLIILFRTVRSKQGSNTTTSLWKSMTSCPSKPKTQPKFSIANSRGESILNELGWFPIAKQIWWWCHHSAGLGYSVLLERFGGRWWGVCVSTCTWRKIPLAIIYMYLKLYTISM